MPVELQWKSMILLNRVKQKHQDNTDKMSFLSSVGITLLTELIPSVY